LNGGAGDDRLEPGEGNNVVDGGTGFDTLVLSGARSTYNFANVNGVNYLVGEEGASRIVGVEQVSFAGQVLATEGLAAGLQPVEAGHVGLVVGRGAQAVQQRQQAHQKLACQLSVALRPRPV